MTDRMCLNCQLYDLDAIKDKAGRVQTKWAAPCRWEFPPVDCWPDSIREYRRYLPTTSGMQPNDGTDCEAFEERKDD